VNIHFVEGLKIFSTSHTGHKKGFTKNLH